jgi:hypothetical protein
MNSRTFPLPLAALSLTTTAVTATATGCTPGIVGEWSLTELEIDGEDYAEYLGYSYSYEYNGCTYSFSVSVNFNLTIEREEGDFEGEFSGGYSGSYTNSCDPSENYSESYSEGSDADVESAGSGVWEIDIDDFDWKLECTVEGDELLCDGDYDGEDIEVVFERD